MAAGSEVIAMQVVKKWPHSRQMLGVQPTMFAHGLFVRYEKKSTKDTPKDFYWSD